TRDSEAGGAVVPEGFAAGSAGGPLAGGGPAGLVPTMRGTMGTPPPAAATANETVESVASVLPELRSDVCWPGRHTMFLHSSLTVDAFESDMRPVTVPAMSPTPPPMNPA